MDQAKKMDISLEDKVGKYGMVTKGMLKHLIQELRSGR